MTSYYDSIYNEMKNHAVRNISKIQQKNRRNRGKILFRSHYISLGGFFQEGDVGQTYHYDYDLVMSKCNKPKIDQHLILYFYFNSVFVLYFYAHTTLLVENTRIQKHDKHFIVLVTIQLLINSNVNESRCTIKNLYISFSNFHPLV